MQLSVAHTAQPTVWLYPIRHNLDSSTAPVSRVDRSVRMRLPRRHADMIVAAAWGWADANPRQRPQAEDRRPLFFLLASILLYCLVCAVGALRFH